mmetsp:Transcript_107064/g.271737  ORF Transcript_107064/g.271737 Transcript_107064/m.271737 type:complete len:156 (-) Transcript_107064:81-548(-)
MAPLALQLCGAMCLILVAGGEARLKAGREDPIIGSTVIHAPNVATDAMKASAAIHTYLGESKARDKVWDQTVEARANAPALYPAKLTDLLKAQNKTIDVLGKATELASKSMTAAKESQKNAETLYKGKMDGLSKDRVGADFKSEAAGLKMAMQGP